MPKLDWIGKQCVENYTDEVPFRLLRRVPEASVGEDSGNVIVHGNSLKFAREEVSEADGCPVRD